MTKVVVRNGNIDGALKKFKQKINPENYNGNVASFVLGGKTYTITFNFTNKTFSVKEKN